MESSWYALAVHARQERAAAAAVTPIVDEVFLPLRVERRLWRDRVKRLELALFPGYLFVRTPLTAAKRVQLLRPRWTLDLVGRLPGSELIARAIPEHEIASLRTAVSSGRLLEPELQLSQGTPVVVVAGPLRGVRGIIQQEAGARRRLVVQVELLGRGVRTELSTDEVVRAVDAEGRYLAGAA